MKIFDKLYYWARRAECPATTVYSRNCIAHIDEDFVGYVVNVSKKYRSSEIFVSKRFLNFAAARHFAVSMSDAISGLLATDMIRPISQDLVIESYRVHFFGKIRRLLFPLTTKFSY